MSSVNGHDPAQELTNLRRRLDAVVQAIEMLAPELTQRRERYIKSLVGNGGELMRGKVQMLEELLDLPNTIRHRIAVLEHDLDPERGEIVTHEPL